MRIFKPRAPKAAPQGVPLHFHFSGDAPRKAQQEAELRGMPVDTAITRLQMELRKQRKALYHIAEADKGNGQQYAAMTGDELARNYDAWNIYRMSPEVRKKQAAEAQAEIDRILQAVA